MYRLRPTFGLCDHVMLVNLFLRDLPESSKLPAQSDTGVASIAGKEEAHYSIVQDVHSYYRV